MIGKRRWGLRSRFTVDNRVADDPGGPSGGPQDPLLSRWPMITGAPPAVVTVAISADPGVAVPGTVFGVHFRSC